MAKKDVQNLLLALSRNPGGVVEETGLSDMEQALIREGSQRKICGYLEDSASALTIKFNADV